MNPQLLAALLLGSILTCVGFLNFAPDEDWRHNYYLGMMVGFSVILGRTSILGVMRGEVLQAGSAFLLLALLMPHLLAMLMLALIGLALLLTGYRLPPESGEGKA